MRSKHKIAKATDLKLEVMFENEKPVLDRIINKEINVLKSSSSEMFMEEDQDEIDDEAMIEMIEVFLKIVARLKKFY
jgi:hypothetical protein